MPTAPTVHPHRIASPSSVARPLLGSWLSRFERHATSADVLRVLESWVDGLELADGYRWVSRTHPEYCVCFAREVRGQALKVFVDYYADNDYLGLFAYLKCPRDPASRPSLLALLNEINFSEPYGNLELDPSGDRLRFRLCINTHGLRFSSHFLAFLLDSALGLFERHLPQLLPAPTDVGSPALGREF